MRRTAIGLAALLAACATPVSPVDVRAYSQPEIDDALSEAFPKSGDAAARALRPSLDKFGAPTGFVTGQMSAVAESDQGRLFGVGDINRRLTPLPESLFWRIDGRELGDSTSPVSTVHLVFDRTDELPGRKPLTQADVGVRRGHNFTVFEGNVDDRIVVTLYPTAALPERADMQALTFMAN